MRRVVLLFAVAISMASSNEFFFLGHEYSRTPLGDQIDKASVKILKESYLSSSDSNVVTSPLGVLLLLSLYSSGVHGKSREEIMNLLGGTEYKELFDSYGHLSNRFGSMDSSYLTLANKVYVAKEYTVGEEFSYAARTYNSEVEAIDFKDPKSAAAIINQWADEKSKGHIKDPVSEKLLDETMAAALFNIIFFQGHWHVPFKAAETEDKDFHVNRTLTVKKPMMHLQDSLFYTEDDEIGAKMIELPYQEARFRMVVLLPNEVDGLSSVLEKVAEKGLLDDVFALSPAGREIKLCMPKFDIKSSLDFTQILPKLFDSYGHLSNRFGSMDSSYLTLANKVYVAKEYTVGEEFSYAARTYNSEVEAIDFKDPKSAAAIINQWADEKSKGHIKDPVSEKLLDETMAAALFNIIFFQRSERDTAAFRAKHQRQQHRCF